jgi:hypothetical protein
MPLKAHLPHRYGSPAFNLIASPRWAARTPASRTQGSAEVLKEVAALELVLATGVLTITGVLVATAMPQEG